METLPPDDGLTSPPATPITTPRASEDAPEDDDQRSIVNSTFRDTCISIITPSLETDVRDMVRGRVMWRRTSTWFEVLGRVTGAAGTIIAFAGSSDITGDTLSRALSFSAGCLGTTSIVSTLFASFARQQSLERSAAINSVLRTCDVKEIPDVVENLDIQGTVDRT